MRKNYIYFMALFILSTSVFAQKITLTPTVVNGRSVSGGPIDLGGTPNSTVSLNVTVEMPNIPGNSGTLNIYSLNGLNANVVSGGTGGALFFGEGKSASRSFVVNLNWSSFATSGSYIYAEYKTSGSVAYKGYMAVIKNATISGETPQRPADAPDPAKIANTLCCNQTIRLGDKPAPITGSQYLDPYKGQSWAVGSSWAVNGNPNVRILDLDDANKVLTLDHVNELGSFTVVRSLGSVSELNKPYKSNAVTITVVPSPILNNDIYVDGASANSNGFIEIINTNPKSIYGNRSNSSVNLNIFQDPSHISQRTDSFADVESYEWEYVKTNLALGGINKWTTIENETSASLKFFNPKDIQINEDNYYLIRRIAIYKNVKRASNSLKVLLRTIRHNNNICCDQILNITSPGVIESPTIITGSTAKIDDETINGTNLTYTLSYQWQIQPVINNENKVWSDISGATSKDYLPLPLKFVANGRGSLGIQTTYNYRRISSIYYEALRNGKLIKETIKSYSNEVSLTHSNATYTSPTLTLYPNPSSSIINIENKADTYILANAKINIVNIMGTLVNSNNFSVITPNLISINISNLAIGTYFINIETGSSRNIQLTFIKIN